MIDTFPCQEDEKEAFAMLLAEGMFKESMGLAQHDVLEECNHIAMHIYI